MWTYLDRPSNMVSGQSIEPYYEFRNKNISPVIRKVGYGHQAYSIDQMILKHN